MRRTRVDGNKFEGEFVDAVKSASTSIPAHYIRLRTPQSCRAGVKNIADFIVFGHILTIVELKETGEKSFSLNTMDQKEEMEKFQKFFLPAREYYKWDKYPYRVAVIVHFIKEQKFMLYYTDENPFKVLHSKDIDNCIITATLKEMVNYILTGELHSDS